jgi:hypothetical protein
VVPIGGHERGYRFDWRSSAAPKKLAASCRIWFALTGREFSVGESLVRLEQQASKRVAAACANG